MKNIIYLLIGLIIGSTITYLCIGNYQRTSMLSEDLNGGDHIEPKEWPVGHPNSPFSAPGENTVEDSEAGIEIARGNSVEYNGDMNDLGNRDVSISVWYANQAKVVLDLEGYTGHKFKPVWNRRSPIEILEEQLVFMGKFLAESKRLEQEESQQ